MVIITVRMHSCSGVVMIHWVVIIVLLGVKKARLLLCSLSVYALVWCVPHL